LTGMAGVKGGENSLHKFLSKCEISQDSRLR
jgi:hypothetical protein